MSDINRQLSNIFKDMSSIYQYMGGDERFRALAYLKASRAIGTLQEDISVFVKKDSLEEIPGIGESIAEKIKEFVKTGKIKKYEELKKRVPHGIMEMLEIKGFGPQSLKTIHEKLNINSKEELIAAMNDGRISSIKGFGRKKVENMLRGLKLHKVVEERMLLWNALQLGERIVTELKQLKEVKQIDLAGSLRRKKETIGDIDILVACAQKDRKKIVNRFTSVDFAKEVLVKGDTKASIILKENNRQTDLRIVDENEWGSALLYFTGSKEHNIHLRTIAKEKGMKISEYGVYRVKDDKRVAGKTEEEIYNLFGFQWMPPEIREDKGEMELAAKKKIPKLIELKDIKGDLQMHSTWSDGMHSIEELAKFVLKNYNYEYIVITDHSKAERVAGGMSEKEFLKQIKEIHSANKILGKDFIKSGAEVDILNDGSLDLGDELLAQLDWVCASVHTGLNKENTERLIKACENPYVCCIGHPSGRLIGKREEYPVEWKEVFKIAKQTGTALEINAQPDRMDLKDELAFAAREAGVILTISTDSHTTGNFSFMNLGVAVARRAWCTAGDVLNTKSWKEINRFIQSKRSK